MRIRRHLPGAAWMPLVFCVLLVASHSLGAQALCSGKTGNTVATDRLHYMPGETVHAAGTGFAPSCGVGLRVMNPDGASSDASLTTDAAGSFSYAFILGALRGAYAIQVLGLGGATLASATFTNGPTLYTDKSDYHPGETVIMTGNRWLPGEKVKLLVHEVNQKVGDRTLNAKADANGDFTNNNFTLNQTDLGVTFLVTATGQTSGYTAQTTFTDATKTWTGAVSTDWGTAGNWSSSGVPASGDTVNIPGGLTNYPVVSGTFTITALNVNNTGTGATLTVTTGGSLTVSSTSVATTVGASGTLNVTGGTASFVFGITSSGAVTQSGGTVLSQGNITLNSGATFTQSAGTTWLAVNTSTTPADNFIINPGASVTQTGGTIAVKDLQILTNSTARFTQSETSGTSVLKVAHDFKNTGGDFTSTAGTVEWIGGTASGGAQYNLGTNQFFNVQIDAGSDPNFDNDAGGSLLVAGDWSNASTVSLFFGATNSTTVTFNGTAPQTIGGSVATNFRNLTINNSAGVSLSGIDCTVASSSASTGTLTLTSGNITTGSNTMIIAAGGSVSRTSGHVVGNLRKQVSANGTVTKTFEVGTGSTYTPIDLTILSVGSSSTTGTTYLTASSTAGDHPNILTSGIGHLHSVNRYWTLTKGGGWTFASYSATFTFVSGDLDAAADTASFIVQRYSSGVWNSTTTGTRTSTSTQATGITSFSDFAVGDPTVATSLVITSVNGGGNPTAGTGFSVVVQSWDENGNPSAVAANTGVSLSLKTGTGTLGGTLTGTINAGTSSVTISGVTYTKAESGVVITATRTSGDNLAAGDSSPFTVGPGAAAKLGFGTQPSNTVAGQSISPAVTVQVQDANGNLVPTSTASITVAIGTNPGGGTLSGTTTASAVNGVATFSNLSINKSGTGYTLTASSVVSPWYSSSWSFRKAITIDHTKVSGDQTSFPVLISRADSDLASHAQSSGNDILFTSSDATTKLAHEIERYTSGTGTLVAWVKVPSLSSTTDTVLYMYYGNSGAANQQNAAGVWDSNYKGVYHLQQDPNGTAPQMLDSTSNVNHGTANSITSVSGEIDKGINLNTTNSVTAAGSTSLQILGSVTIEMWANVTDVVNGPVFLEYYGGSGETQDVNRLYGMGLNYDGATSDDKLWLEWEYDAGVTVVYKSTVSPSPLTGSWMHYVFVRDNTAKTVTFYSNGAQLGTPVAWTTGPNGGTNDTLYFHTEGFGSGNFDETRISSVVRSAGWVATSYNNQSSPGAFSSVGGETLYSLTPSTSATFNINPGAATQLAFGTQPSNTTAGQSISPAVTVRLLDANGNLTTSTASVTVAIGTNPGSGTLSGTLTVAAVSGVATFSNLSINKVGTGYTLTASSSGLTGATSDTFNITVGSAAQLNFGTQPSNTTAGQSISPAVTVRIEDSNGNLTSSTANVTVAIGTNPGGGTLSGTLTVAAVSGVATFSNLSINKSGTGYTLTASSTGLTGATSNTFNITAGSASQLNFGTQPSNTTAGQSISPAVTVRIEDVNGNLTSSTANVTVAIGTNPGGGTLSGTPTVAAVAGVATFSNLSINKSGTGYTLTASSSGLTGATSNTFNITAGSASQLNFGTQPSNTTAGQSISPAVTVRIEDANGNLTSSTANVTVAIGTNPGGGTLSGTLTVAAVSGVATFSNLSINNPGTGYTLTASSSGLTGATSSSFNIIATNVDLSVTVTDGVTRAFACSTVTYTIVVTNNGPDAVTAATVTDNFPADLTGVTWTCSASSGSSCGASSGSGNIATTANLANGGTATYTATGTVARTTNGTMSNTASAAVPSNVVDPDSGNNSATDTDSLNYWVNNATGSDSNPGTQSQPYASIGKAASVIGNSGTVFVQVGNSQSGTPYAANVSISGAGQGGSGSCLTLFQGIANGSGQLPLMRGTDPTVDMGFDVSSNHVQIDGFEIANTLVALTAEPDTSGVVFSNNFVQVPDLAYGILLYSSSGSLVQNNRVDASASNSFFGIWDYSGAGDTVDGNKVSGHAGAGLRSDFSTGLTLQRNIVKGNYIGVHLANAGGEANLYNNTVDANAYLGLYAESPGGAVTSRNNIVINNGIGWGWNGSGTISSDYDNVYGNTSNYSYHGTVAAGAHSMSSDPGFLQTSDPTLPTYFRLISGSPCIDNGVNVGLPFLGSTPDVGAVETQ